MEIWTFEHWVLQVTVPIVVIAFTVLGTPTLPTLPLAFTVQYAEAFITAKSRRIFTLQDFRTQESEGIPNKCGKYKLKKSGTNGTHSQFLVLGQSDEPQNAVWCAEIVPYYSAAQKPQELWCRASIMTQYKVHRISSIWYLYLPHLWEDSKAYFRSVPIAEGHDGITVKYRR